MASEWGLVTREINHMMKGLEHSAHSQCLEKVKGLEIEFHHQWLTIGLSL